MPNFLWRKDCCDFCLNSARVPKIVNEFCLKSRGVPKLLTTAVTFYVAPEFRDALQKVVPRQLMESSFMYDCYGFPGVEIFLAERLL